MKSPTKKAVTLSDVAEVARVSKATVSNVFSRPERVRPALRQRVEAAAESLGYDGPDPRGRLLSSGKVNAIGVVPPAAFGISLFFKNAYVRTFLEGVAAVCEEHGVGLSLVSGRDDQKTWGIRNAVVDGFILGGIEDAALIEPVRRRRLPFVLTTMSGGPDVSSVLVEDRDGGRQLARHLIALGHRRFAIAMPLRELRAPVFHAPAKTVRHLIAPIADQSDRLDGIAEVLEEAGIRFSAVPMLEACITRDEVAAFGNGAALLFDNAPEATAIVALTDSVALGLLEEARRRGLSVPRDLSITGFDDIPEAALAEPPLTTIAQPTMEKGRMAARLLLEGGPPRHVVLPVELIVRASTGPAPRR